MIMYIIDLSLLVFSFYAPDSGSCWKICDTLTEVFYQLFGTLYYSHTSCAALSLILLDEKKKIEANRVQADSRR